MIMKDKIRAAFKIVRNHKAFTGVIAVCVVAVIITTVAACVSTSTKRSTESYAASAVSENTVSSSTVSSSISAVSSVTSSVPAVSSTPTTSTATKVSTAPSTSAKQTSSAVTPKVKTNSRKASSTVSKASTSKTSTTTNPLYVAIPQSQELKYLSIAGGQLVLNVNAFTLTGYVSSADEQQYIGDDAYYSVTEKSTGKVMISGQNGAVANNNQIGVATPLVTYEHGNDYWLKPATYTVHVWCQKSDTSKNTTAGRPQKVDVCTFTVSVNEHGYK